MRGGQSRYTVQPQTANASSRLEASKLEEVDLAECTQREHGNTGWGILANDS